MYSLPDRRFNIVVDTQWGSCGKGLVASYFASRHQVTHASTNNLPNAGHTGIFNGKKFVSKILPVAAFMNSLGGRIVSYIGAGAGFTLEQIKSEIEICKIQRRQLFIHPRAIVVVPEDAADERAGALSTKHVASTMQGSGAAQVKKMMRGANVRLAHSYEELSGYIFNGFAEAVAWTLDTKGTHWLHEGSQGFSLGLNHGSHYPQCTSRECNVAREMSDMGVAPSRLGDVIGVLRPYPIRVGNVVEDGELKGHSGGAYSDQQEITWDDVRLACNGPDSLGQGELTTVTKRLRRVFTFSHEQIRQACIVNGVTHYFVNFANYIDWSIYGQCGVRTLESLPEKIQKFVTNLEGTAKVPVKWLGTGPDASHVIEIV